MDGASDRHIERRLLLHERENRVNLTGGSINESGASNSLSQWLTESRVYYEYYAHTTTLQVASYTMEIKG